MAEASLVAILKQPPDADGAELRSLPAAVDWLEVRADLVGEVDPMWLRNHFKGRLIYALRSRANGESLGKANADRGLRLEKASRYYDCVEIEGKDLSEDLLAKIPPEKRIVSWHGPAKDLEELKRQFLRLSSVRARNYKLVTTASGIADEFMCLALLKSLNRSDTTAYADGKVGFWTRVAALQFGAPFVYGLAAAEEGNPSEPTISKLIADYGLPSVSRAKSFFAIVGDPIFHSLSPRLHNAAYRAIDYPGLFVPLQVECFEEFWQQFVQSRVLDSLGMPFNGMTVASPHKEAALTIARNVSRMAGKAESANILVRNNGWWNADTTDTEVVRMASRNHRVQVSAKKAAVVGCGGAGRAIAAALVQSGAGVTLTNRGAERGEHAAELLSLPYIPLREFSAEGYDIVVNATPVGRDDDEVAFDLETMNDDAVVIDLAYGSRPTPLVSNSLARRHIVFDGRDVLLSQVLRQFQLMTGVAMSEAVAAQALSRSGSRVPEPAVMMDERAAAGSGVIAG